MSDHEPTLNDIARLCGVSAMTVSRVLNDRPGVGQNTRERVLEAIRSAGYVPNLGARGLARSRTQVLGMVVPDLSTQYIAEIVRGAGEAAARHEYDLVLYTSTHGARAFERIDALTRGVTDGLLVVLPPASQEFPAFLQRTGQRCVVIDHRGEARDVPAVTADNYSGAREAVDHLVSLGHRRIGFITGRMDTHASLERLRGYREGLLVHGLGVDETLVCGGDFLQPGGFQAARALLELPVAPTAMFASNDVMAFGAMEAVKDGGLRVPADVSVIGFDDIPMASQVHPPLTTVRQPLYEMGAAAANLLITLLAGITPSVDRLELGTQVVVRRSTAPARQPAR